MIFDIFFSICQTSVDGYIPSEKEMFKNFFDQVKLADELGYETAWLAETHLSCQIQKEGNNPVIPHFEGEIGLNTDILQLGHKIFSITKNINIGSAIRNILCNGGPIAHAEAVKTFLTLHSLNPNETRKLNLGFASGRFEFSNKPYGIVPRNEMEKQAWTVLKGKIFKEALEIFLKLLKGEIISSKDISKKILSRKDFRSEEDWQKVIKEFGKETSEIEIPPYWNFEKIGVIPFEAPLENLNLIIGSHDKSAQVLANKFYPCGVFNLSITPSKKIEETHKMMKENYHQDGGKWNRNMMPRTVLIFIDEDNNLAIKKANAAIENYWKALEGTIDNEKVQNAVNNALIGTPEIILEKIKQTYHENDRLMLWFDFNNHDNDNVKNSMKLFKEKVIDKL